MTPRDPMDEPTGPMQPPEPADDGTPWSRRGDTIDYPAQDSEVTDPNVRTVGPLGDDDEWTEDDERRYQARRQVERRRAARRRRQAAAFAVVVLAVLAIGVTAAGVYQGRWEWPLIGDDEVATTQSQPCPTPTVTAAAPAEVTTVVLNSTDRAGLAAAVAAELQARGFVVSEIANDPAEEAVAEPAQVRHGPEGLQQARAVAAQIGGAVLVDDGRAGEAVEVSLGTGYSEMVPVPEAQAALAPAPVPSPAGCVPAATPSPATTSPVATTPATASPAPTT